ncbi:2-oxo-4-hydroxy-4-carboxy-5-ureidoimidazoline decarboxylase [Streptomyces sp. DT24]|uniref:2-oxo-4-hydroxy-4-carboxy-5-ureidoimidazoline decarboxylase n=1 Tax=unclassified Streptomyces TaxID=2593676 RepID=UPI0023B9E1A8|nr:2-oxo-4-hydroxy-4-carboxy-5-ureidoimidazoline decarboxylase [Streptomyces sp. AM 4-1-1]WEH37603.1 2-oxo-4-hydroxy-4-carboxy-5-ureidoimidazoline decarboxylase [Streptomyces sp. AM 4-1-1]
MPARRAEQAQVPAGPHRGDPGLTRFNTAPPAEAEAALLDCFGSHRWARRLAAHRPYPDLHALLAAADEAGYDLAPTDLTEALARETSPGLHHSAPHAAHLALRAAHAAYERRFGHVFVICLDAFRPAEHPDQVLADIRARLAHEPDEERVVTADEMRRLARGRIIELVTGPGRADGPV